MPYGPRSPEGIAAVTRTIQAVNAARLNVRRAPPDSHGVHAITRAQPATMALAAEILTILQGDGLGHIRPADRVTAELLAVCLRRIFQAEAYLDRFGLTGRRGEVRPVAGLLVQLLREARGYTEALGMTPLARAKLGLDQGRAFDLAAALAAMPTKDRRGDTPMPPHSEETAPRASGGALRAE